MNIILHKELFQWDKDRWVEIEKAENESIESVQFSIDGRSAYYGKLKEGTKYLIPNSLLLKAGQLKVYVCVCDEYGNRTETRKCLKIFAREKPESYVEDEQVHLWDELSEKIGALKGGQTGQVLAKRSENDYDIEWRNASETSVSSWNGRQGAVVPEANDYDYTQIAGLSQQLEELKKRTSSSFTFKQKAPSKQWKIQHNLKKFPAVSIADSAGSVVIGEVKYIDENNLVVEFSAGFSGVAHLN